MPLSRWKKSGAIELAGFLLYVTLAVVLVVLEYLRFDGLFSFVQQSTFSIIMIYFMGIDFRQWRVPVVPALIAFIIGLSFSFLHTGATLEDRALGALGGVLFLWSILAITTYFSRWNGTLKRDEFSVGTGDLLIVAVIASFVGYLEMPLILALGCSQALAAFVAGKLFSSLALSSPWPDTKASYPLGAFLCLAALEILIISL